MRESIVKDTCDQGKVSLVLVFDLSYWYEGRVLITLTFVKRNQHKEVTLS